MPKSVYKRRKSRNKPVKQTTNDNWKDIYDGPSDPKDASAVNPTPTKLDVLMSNLETEINRAIAKMKEMF